MVRLINAWAPAVAGPKLGQFSANPLMPSLFPAPAASAAQPSALGAGAAGVLYMGMAALSTMFMYGVARDSKSSMVKTSGYIIAGLTAIGGLIIGGGTVVLAATGNLSGSKS